MTVKRLITPYEHYKKHTYSGIETITQEINKCYIHFVNCIIDKKSIF